MEKEGKREGSRAKDRGSLEENFEFYALLATGFPSRCWRVRRRGGWRHVCTGLTVVTYLSAKIFPSRFNAFCSAIFRLAVSFAN